MVKLYVEHLRSCGWKDGEREPWGARRAVLPAVSPADDRDGARGGAARVRGRARRGTRVGGGDRRARRAAPAVDWTAADLVGLLAPVAGPALLLRTAAGDLVGVAALLTGE